MLAWLESVLRLLWAHHFGGSLAIVLLVATAISVQISDRRTFADSEVRADVMDRWGTPIVQPAPSVRYVESGAVFSTLQALPLHSQQVVVEAAMNYRKRGLVYFSGFDFRFRGDYRVRNAGTRDIEIAFVFPIQLERNRVLLSDLSFEVDGRPVELHLEDGTDRLLWTGRVRAGAEAAFAIAYRGRGLESFRYALDPALPVRDLSLKIGITGGENFDYEPGVVPAANVQADKNRTQLEWAYGSLASGVPLGVVLPSVKAWDEIIATMVRRSWATFLLFFAGLTGLALWTQRPPRIWESYLFAAAYGFFFVLLPYFAAFLPFSLAYAACLAIIGVLVVAYAGVALGADARRYAAWLVAATLVVPTLAVISEGYTGLIYSLEILSGIIALMYATTRPAFQAALARSGLAQGPTQTDSMQPPSMQPALAQSVPPATGDSK